MQCSCPDWAVPCKHLASVIYKVSAEIGNNPFLVFSLHNVDLLHELATLGLVIKKENIEIPKLRNLYLEKSDRPGRKCNPESAYRKLTFSKLTPIHGPLTALLSPNPAFYTASGSDIREKYQTALTRIVKNTQRAACGKVSLPEFFSASYIEEMGISRHESQEILLDESLQPRVMVNGREYQVRDFLKQLSEIQGSRTYDYQPSTASLHSALHISVQLVANGAIVPQVVQLPDKNIWFTGLSPKILLRRK